MNKTYRSVWNDSTGTWVAAQENARGQKKKSKSVVARTTSVLIAAGGLGAGALLVPDLAAAGQLCSTNSTNSGRVSVSDQNGTNVMSGCGDPGGGLLTLNHDMTIMEAGGTAMWVDGTSHTVNFRPAGSTGSVISFTTNGRLTGLSNGTGSSDAATIGQLSSTAALFGAGAGIDSSGAIIAPSYALTNANTIDGTTGAAADVGKAFSTVDAALGKLNSNINNINDAVNGNGIKRPVQKNPCEGLFTFRARC